MGKSADQISQEIDQQRADAGDKIDHLQEQLQGTANDMQQQVQDTAEHLRGQAEGMVNDAVESVQQFDFHQHVQDRPLVSVGAALLGGFLLGSMMEGDDSQRRSDRYYSGGETSGGGQHSGGGIASGIRSAAQKSGLEDTLSNAAAALMGSLTEQVKGTLDQRMPGYAEKMDTAQQKSGSFTDKAKVTQHEAQRA